MDKFSRDTLQKTMQFLSLKGYKVITEFALPNKKRVDIIALNLKKEILIIEVKSNTRDIKLDKKWKNYLKYCNYFYFACSEKLKNHMGAQNHVICVSEKGKAKSSMQMSRFLFNGTRDLVFFIGGPDGHPKFIIEKADTVLSLS